MDTITKLEIGRRLRRRRENAGYTRERLGELCSLSPRFIANIELGDSTFSLDSLTTICQVLSCSSDYLLFGKETDDGSPWSDTISRIHQFDPRYEPEINKILQAIVELLIKSESYPDDLHKIS